MKLLPVLLFSTLLPTTALANTQICTTEKYHAYIDASLTWYRDLVSLTVKKNPELQEVGNWFLQGRQHHFALNQTAFDWYLANEPTQLHLTLPVESWLKLTQQEIKTLSMQDTPLGQAAKHVFDDRQTKPHRQNYALRSAFANLLTHPAEIQHPLNAYNEKMQTITHTQCDR